MPLASRRARRPSIDIWPGFVDALAQLLMVIIFMLLVFTAGQFFLSDALSGRDKALKELQQQITELSSLLVFLGLLGTFWGLIETVGSVGSVIQNLKVGGEAGAVFDTLREGLAAPLGGMGISFSSSLFGLAGSLALGFLDLQAGQAQNRFYMELEDWLSTIVSDLTIDGSEPRALVAPSGEMRSAIDKLKEAVADTGSNRAATAAMANLAEAIHGLVSHMRTEQQMIRDWADAQAAQSREMNRLLERIAGEEPRKDELRKTVR